MSPSGCALWIVGRLHAIETLTLLVRSPEKDLFTLQVGGYWRLVLAIRRMHGPYRFLTPLKMAVLSCGYIRLGHPWNAFWPPPTSFVLDFLRPMPLAGR